MSKPTKGIEAGIQRMLASIQQLKTKRGPYYRKWLRAMKAAKSRQKKES